MFERSPSSTILVAGLVSFWCGGSLVLSLSGINWRTRFFSIFWEHLSSPQVLFLWIQLMRRFWIYEEDLYCRNMISWKLEFAVVVDVQIVHQFWWLNLQRVSKLAKLESAPPETKSFNKKTSLHRSRLWISHPFSCRAADIKLSNWANWKLVFCTNSLPVQKVQLVPVIW